MYINLLQYYDLDSVNYWTGANGQIMYTVNFISKSTGEIIDWTFTEELFNKLLYEMETYNNWLEEELFFLKHQMWWFL